MSPPAPTGDAVVDEALARLGPPADHGPSERRDLTAEVAALTAAHDALRGRLEVTAPAAAARA